ncbi:Vgr family protein [Nitrospirillum viridazoti Y2]|nr:Vgr family protein [Nitrospirillum amazonense Y2]
MKVQFFWDRRGQSNEGSSCWVRVAQGWAGRGFGAQTIPRMGMEVVVAFLEGNPDRPVILGSVPNSETTAPLGLPAQKTQTTFRTASSPGGGGFNLFTLEDKAGAEEIAFHSQKDLSMVVQNNAFETVTKASVRQAGQVLAFKVGNSSIQFTPDNIILSSNGSTAVLDKDGIRYHGGKIWLNMKEPAPAKTEAKKDEHKVSAEAAVANTPNAKVLYAGASASYTNLANGVTGEAKAEVGMANIGGEARGKYGAIGGRMQVATAGAEAKGGITSDGFGGQVKAEAVLASFSASGSLGSDPANPYEKLELEHKQFSAEAKGDALFGNDGTRSGFALQGKASASVLSGGATNTINIPLDFIAPGKSLSIKTGVSGDMAAAGAGAGIWGYKDLAENRVHVGGFGELEVLAGGEGNLDISYGDKLKGP